MQLQLNNVRMTSEGPGSSVMVVDVPSGTTMEFRGPHARQLPDEFNKQFGTAGGFKFLLQVEVDPEGRASGILL
jgi:hypothetical protein